MKTLTASRMGSEIIQIILIGITALIITPGQSHDIPRIKHLDCVNDFETTMVCSWEVVNGETNCSADFQLKYTDFAQKSLYCQDVDNEYIGAFRAPSKCICNIHVIGFTTTESYTIEVESQGQRVGNATIHVLSSVKPKPPSGVSVNLTEPEIGVTHWKTNYENQTFINSMLSFQIQFISMQDDKTILQNDIQFEPRYTFGQRDLYRGQKYKVRVRTKHSSEEQTREIWSEWSPDVVFRNDYALTIMDWMPLIIPLSSIGLILLIVSCYFCIIRAKEKWWNNIPNPARSKLAESKLIQENYFDPTGKPKSCGNCISQLVKAHKKSKQLPKEHPVKDGLNLMRNNMIKIFFEPEKVVIERCIHLYPREDDKLYQEDLPEEEEEDIHLMATDLSIGRMFCDILCDSSMKVEALEQLHVDNTFGSLGSSILRDHFQKTERHLPLSMVSQESGYQSYDSDDSPGDSKSDGPNPLYLVSSSLNQGDSLPYAPVSSMDETGSRIGKEDAFVNSGYNSFASALAEASSRTMEGDNISVFSLGTMFCQPNYHHSLQNPKSILYYNTRCFPTHYEEDLRPTITSASDHRVETCPASVSEVPGYQSFTQAVQQGDTSRSTTCLVLDSGYKPFDSLTRTSTNSLDNISGLSQFDHQSHYKDSVDNNEDLPQPGMVNGGTDRWNDTQSSGFHLTQLDFSDEHKGSPNQASDIHYGIDRTLKVPNEPLALTFDISNHLRNLANIQGPKMSLGSDFVGLPTNLISFLCSLDEAPIIHDDLLDKNCLHIDKGFPMKFENMSYFVPLYSQR